MDYYGLNQQELISLISGITLKDTEKYIEYEEKEWMKFTGNQWNENWEWDRQALSKFPKWWLIEFYEKLKNSNEKDIQ